MSFFDKIKTGLQGAKERLTGEHGELLLTLDKTTAARGEEILAKLVVKANVELTINSIKLVLLGKESRKVERDINPEVEARVDASCRTYETVIPVTGTVELREGASQNFVQKVTIPKDCPISFQGDAFSHDYELAAVADVAWAVNLQQALPITISAPPPEPKAGTIMDKNATCSTKLDLSNIRPVPGDLCSLKISFAPNEKARLHQVLVDIRSVEMVKAEYWKKRLPGSSLPPEEKPIETRMLSITNWEESTSQALNPEPGAVQSQTLDFILPDNCPPTYSGKEAKHEVQLQLRVQLEDQFGEKVTLKQTHKLLVYPDQGEAPARIFFVWRPV